MLTVTSTAIFFTLLLTLFGFAETMDIIKDWRHIRG